MLIWSQFIGYEDGLATEIAYDETTILYGFEIMQEQIKMFFSDVLISTVHVMGSFFSSLINREMDYIVYLWYSLFVRRSYVLSNKIMEDLLL